MLRAADIARLHPDEYEFLWRSILRKEHEATYRRLDGLGVDCMTDRTVYQIYSHQAGSWSVVQAKLRTDLASARQALALGGHLKTGHSWTSQNRPLRGVRDRVKVYLVASSWRKSGWTLVRQLRGPHLST